jgi:hypothetical protein
MNTRNWGVARRIVVLSPPPVLMIPARGFAATGMTG